MSLSIFLLLEIALWGVPGSWDEISALLWSCAYSSTSGSVRLLLVHAEHSVSFGPLFFFHASWDTIFLALHCPTIQQCSWGGCYVGVVPPPGNSVGYHGEDQGTYTGFGPSTPATDLNYKDVILRCYFEFSPSCWTGTYIGEAGAERKRVHERCAMPCSFSYPKLLLQ